MLYPFAKAFPHSKIFVKSPHSVLNIDNGCFGMVYSESLKNNTDSIKFAPQFCHELPSKMEVIGSSNVLPFNNSPFSMTDDFFQKDFLRLQVSTFPAMLNPLNGHILLAAQEASTLPMFKATHRLFDPIYQRIAILGWNPKFLGNGLLSSVKVHDERFHGSSFDYLIWTNPSTNPFKLNFAVQSPMWDKTPNEIHHEIVLDQINPSFIYSLTSKYDENLNILMRSSTNGHSNDLHFLSTYFEDDGLYKPDSLNIIKCNTEFSVLDESLNPFVKGLGIYTGRTIHPVSRDAHATLSLIDFNIPEALAIWQANLPLRISGEDSISETLQVIQGINDLHDYRDPDSLKLETHFVQPLMRSVPHPSGFTVNFDGYRCPEYFEKNNPDFTDDVEYNVINKFNNGSYSPISNTNLVELMRLCLSPEDALKSIEENWSPNTISKNFNKANLHRLEHIIAFSHAGYFLSCGHGTHPALANLATPKRILSADTRIKGENAFSQLFILNDSRPMSPNEFRPDMAITSMTDRMIGDVYSILTTDKSIFMIDKRMPNKTVFHWPSPLRKMTTSVKFVENPSPDQSDSPDVFMIVGSQMNFDISLYGLRLSTDYPQIIGPSLTIDPPISVPEEAHFGSCRLDSVGLAGTTVTWNNCGCIPIITVTGLSSRGDLVESHWAWRQKELDSWVGRTSKEDQTIRSNNSFSLTFEEMKENLILKKKNNTSNLTEIMRLASRNSRKNPLYHGSTDDSSQKIAIKNHLQINRDLLSMVSDVTNPVSNCIFKKCNPDGNPLFNFPPEQDYPALVDQLRGILRTGKCKPENCPDRDAEERDRASKLDKDLERAIKGTALPVAVTSVIEHAKFCTKRLKGLIYFDRYSPVNKRKPKR